MNLELPRQIAIRYKKSLHRLGVVLGGLLLLWGLAWLAVPPLLKTQLESRLQEALGRQVTIGQVDFSPWSLELTLSDIAIARAATAQQLDSAATGPQVAIKRIYIDAALQSLFRLAPVVDGIRVESPKVHLTHLGQGHYDVDDVLARLAARPSVPDASPLRFALYNVVLADGALVFSDVAHGKVHHLDKLQLNLPFLSNLDADREVQVLPKLAFDLNGNRFDSTAQTTPFAQVRKTDAHLVFKNLDLAPYLAYQPAGLPVRLASAVLSVDVKLAFEQAAHTVVTLSGLVTAGGVSVVAPGPAGQAAGAAGNAPVVSDLLAFDQLSVGLKAVRPLVQDVQLSRVELTQPRLSLRRDRAGVLNWLALFKPVARQNATESIAENPMNKGGEGQNSLKKTGVQAAAPWTLGVDEMALNGGEILWVDETTAQPVQLTLTALQWQAHALAWPLTQPMPFEGSGSLQSAVFNFKGTATDQAADITAKLAELPLSVAAPYLAGYLTPSLSGVVNAELGLGWKAASIAEPQGRLALQVPSLSLDKLALASGHKTPLASIRQVQLQEGALDLTGQTATLGRVRVTQPKVIVTRAVDGRWMFEDWLTARPAVPTASLDASPASPGKPWALAVNDLQVTAGALTFQDQIRSRPVALDISALSVRLQNFSTASGKPFGLNVSAQLRHGNTEPGSLAWRGSTSLSPLALQGELTAERLPVHALEPYVSDTLNVALLRVDASFKGKVNVAQHGAGFAVQVRGDTRLEDVLVQTLAQAEPYQAAEDLLRWKSLNLSALEIASSPGAATRVDVQGTVLSDFYAKLVLSEAGRLNLHDVMKSDNTPVAGATASAETAQNTSKTIAQRPLNTRATADSLQNSAPAAQIHVGPVTLLGGRVDFTDRFIKPNYSADLTELTGRLSAFASQAATGEIQLADLELRGRAEGSATLEVLGKINPLVQPLALDIKGRVRDLELPPLSTYSVRYAGYGIERGKLSVDVAYKVQPDGQLTASNNIVLNQLKFGDKVPGASASLPVKLAVALLADRNGVIDINLPVSGSLNDPQFRLLPIVFKIIGNLIVKAITAPFSLLASALGGGGGDELSIVAFEPGSARLSTSAKTGLDKVAKALQDRPALKMTVVGTASLELEREAFKREQLRALVQAEKRHGQTAGATPSDPAAETDVSSQDYPALLKAVYKRADFPKPRNLIGLAKDLPVPEMEALLLANLDATEPAMQALAVKRGVAVRDYLSSLKLPTDRLFLGAAKAVPPEAKWTPRAELNLATE